MYFKDICIQYLPYIKRTNGIITIMNLVNPKFGFGHFQVFCETSTSLCFNNAKILHFTQTHNYKLKERRILIYIMAIHFQMLDFIYCNLEM